MDKRSFKDFRLVTQAPARSLTELIPLSPKTFKSFSRKISSQERKWLAKNDFHARPDMDDQAYQPGSSDRLIRAYIAVNDPYPGEGVNVRSAYDDKFLLSPHANFMLPGTYALSDRLNLTARQKYGLMLGWGLAAYEFNKHKTEQPPPKKVFLKIPDEVDQVRLSRELTATGLAQDFISEPSNKLTCDEFIRQAKAIAGKFKARFSVIIGDKLLEKNFPQIHAVGRASAEPPALIDMHWGDPSHPRVTLVGKGVVFDSGGINKKDPDSMRTMKTDIAGAAHALAVAYMVMDAGLPIHLRVLLPIVENSDGPKAYKPGDIIPTRSGKTVEIVNSDAEGRMILSDTLHEASHPALWPEEEGKRPKLILSYGTLTGHGHDNAPDFGATFSNKDHVRDEFHRAAAECQEYFLPMLLLRRLEQELKGRDGEDAIVGDLRQCNDDHTRYDLHLAAVYLYLSVRNKLGERGLEPDWVYNDLQVWRPPKTPATLMPAGLPVGAFAQGVRASFYMLEKRFGSGPGG